MTSQLLIYRKNWNQGWVNDTYCADSFQEGLLQWASRGERQKEINRYVEERNWSNMEWHVVYWNLASQGQKGNYWVKFQFKLAKSAPVTTVSIKAHLQYDCITSGHATQQIMAGCDWIGNFTRCLEKMTYCIASGHAVLSCKPRCDVNSLQAALN